VLNDINRNVDYTGSFILHILGTSDDDSQVINMFRNGTLEPSRETTVVPLAETRHGRAIRGTDYDLVGVGETVSKLWRCRRHRHANVLESFEQSTIRSTSRFLKVRRERERERERERDAERLFKKLDRIQQSSRSFRH